MRLQKGFDSVVKCLSGGVSLISWAYFVQYISFDMIFYIFLQSHSIHGMNDEGTGNKPYKEMGTLTYEEKKFLLAVERGDVASVRR